MLRFTFLTAQDFTFRAELFIVISAIAWTYLLHAWYRRKGINYRYRARGKIQTTKHGQERYWELGKCLRHSRCLVSKPAVTNSTY